MGVLERAIQSARDRRVRVVFPEWNEPRISEAASHLEREGLCLPISVSELTEAQISWLADARDIKLSLVHRLLKKPLYQAAAMVACGEADVMVAGADHSTRRVIEAATMVIGMKTGVALPSSFFLMRFPSGQELIFSDCALNVDPSAKDLAEIASASAATGAAFFGEARVALLSFSTGSSGAGPSVAKVREAAELTGFSGPVQADAALNVGISAKKGLDGGNANVLIFPSLDAGNIGYKLCQELAGAQALGPFLQGLRRPVCDLSRGATVDDIVASTVVTVAMSALEPDES